MNQRKIGVWLVGALGSIAATVILGAVALRKKLTSPTGMITCTELFSGVDLVPVEALAFGGCDIREASLLEAVKHMVRASGCVDPAMVNVAEVDVARIQPYIVPGIARNCGETIESLVQGSRTRTGSGTR